MEPDRAPPKRDHQRDRVARHTTVETQQLREPQGTMELAKTPLQPSACSSSTVLKCSGRAALLKPLPHDVATQLEDAAWGLSDAELQNFGGELGAAGPVLRVRRDRHRRA